MSNDKTGWSAQPNPSGLSVPHIRRFAAAVLLCLAATACSNTIPNPSSSGAQTKTTSQNTAQIEITPTTPTVISGGRIQLSAAVMNTADTAVEWRADAGTITSTGLFTAPSVKTSQTINVMAISPLARAAASTMVTVTVPVIARLAISTTSLPSGTAGTSYSATLVGAGGTQPYAWTIVSGALPAGLQLNPGTGVVSGLTSQTGSYVVTVQVVDHSGNATSEKFTLTMAAQQQTGSNCGPPTYPCSRADTAVIAATAPPQLGSNPNYYGGHLGAGIIAVDPAYNNRILRVTDANIDPSRPGESYMTGSSAEKSVTSYDETMFLTHNESGNICLFQYNASSFSSQLRGCYNNIGIRADFGYTAADQHAFYSFYQEKLRRYQVDPTTFTVTIDPTFNNGLGYFDPDNPNCLNGLIAANNWYTSDSALSSDDNTIIVAIGPSQDKNPYFVVWNAEKGCQWMNVQTWQVSQGWNTGLSNPQKITFASGVTPTQAGGIHNAQIDRSGAFGVLTIHHVTTMTQKIFWTIGTNQVDDTCVKCQSHWACDFGVCFWDMGPGTGYSLSNLTVGSLNYVLDVNTTPVANQWGNDVHMSHANAEQGQKLIYLAGWQPGTGGSSVSQVWKDELVGVNWDGSQRTIRFNKNWASGYGGFSGSTRCSISRQGHYAICDSDLQMYNLDKGFGNGLNQDTCDHTITGAKVGTNGCRSDVMLFELR